MFLSGLHNTATRIDRYVRTVGDTQPPHCGIAPRRGIAHYTFAGMVCIHVELGLRRGIFLSGLHNPATRIDR